MKNSRAQTSKQFSQLDQSMMRKLKKLADRTGRTVDDLISEGILEFLAKCQAKTELKNSQIISES
jgi:hypothetical protein